jgi:hypothetical protein
VRIVLIPLLFGLLGVAALAVLFFLPIVPPNPVVAFLTIPGAFAAYGFIQGQYSFIVVFAAATLVQFVVYACVGVVVAIASLFVC